MSINTKKLSVQNEKLQQLVSKLENLYPEMVSIRRHLHQYPEISIKKSKHPTTLQNTTAR
ncbi:hypothetical protein [Planococcus antarcticus]|uniref:hypothetical protein n=1 Tax=Planococcus antarcticus TaxID=161360 RepID=UPI000B3110FB